MIQPTTFKITHKRPHSVWIYPLKFENGVWIYILSRDCGPHTSSEFKPSLLVATLWFQTSFPVEAVKIAAEEWAAREFRRVEFIDNKSAREIREIVAARNGDIYDGLTNTW